MQSRLHVLQNTGRMLGIIAVVLAIVPMTVGAQTLKRDLLTIPGLGAGGVEIGVSVRDLSEADAKTATLPAPTGAYIESVRADTPASRAGFRATDVIVTFDGERVRSAAHFARLVDETPDGRTVPVIVQRGGERVTLHVAPESSMRARRLTFNRAPSLAAREPFAGKVLPEVFPFKGSIDQVLGGPARLGVTVQELAGQLGEYFGASSGVLVTSVTDNSPARTAGLKAGDVITQVNGQSTANAGDLRRHVSAATGEVTLTIVRDRKEQTVKTTLAGDTVAPKAKSTIVR